MKQFRFSLEQVLQYRIQIEHEWEGKLGQITGECNLIRRQIAETYFEKREAMKYSENENIHFMKNVSMYMILQDQKRANYELDLAEKEKEREKVRLKYLEVSRDRKVISKLKEKKEMEYRKYKKQEESKNLDEIAVSAKWREGAEL